MTLNNGQIDEQYRTRGEGASPSEVSDPSRLPLDVNSESDSFTTRARGVSGVDPGPLPLGGVNLLLFFTADRLDGLRKRLVDERSLIFSIFTMHRQTDSNVGGGAMDVAFTRPKKGFSAVAGIVHVMDPSSVYTR
jgi:hypothetical protein